MTEVEKLKALLNACHAFIAGLERRAVREDELVRAVRETCRAVEARLAELGIPFEPVVDA